jgi:polyhydroxybutyrate depolymerase
MRHLWLLLPPLLACSPLQSPREPDGGTSQVACFAPRDGGALLTGLTAPVAGCSRSGSPTGVIDLAAVGWSNAGGVLVVPPSAPGTPLPVVFAFHGAYSSGQTVRTQMGLEGPADGGAIFIYPNAVQGTWDIGPRSLDGRRTDVLLRLLSENYCIDPTRISIAGFSAGAVYTLFLGCNVGDAFHALAVVAGTDRRFDTRCCKATALSALFIHGTLDDAIPLVEGEGAREDYRYRDGCSLGTTPVDSYCLGYSGCTAPLAVDYCWWPGSHEMPDWAGEEIWGFVSRP